MPDDGMRMPILTSAIANELQPKAKRLTADPVFQLLNMTFSPAAASLKGADGMHRGYCFGINVVNCEIQPVARRGVLTSPRCTKIDMPANDAIQSPDFSIWSFCFAKGQVPREFIEGVPVGSGQGLLQIPMVYSVIAAASRNDVCIVDTGFASGKSMTGRSFADFETPDAVLAKVELQPKDVKTILLTHLHFDHVGNIDAFPDATILLQRYEYERWKHALKTVADQPADKQNWILSSMNLNDIVRFDRAIASGRVKFIEGSHQIGPG